jgi:hypothetical protein
MRVRLIASVVVIGALCGVAAAALHARAGISVSGISGSVSPGDEHWREIAWPFPRDGWPSGRAFRCDAAACGEAVELYARPKIGFCNCDSGVADEVDRVADLDLMSQRFDPLAAGEVVKIADMAGRSRRYDLRMTDGSRHAAVGFALSRRCDLLVAVAQGEGAPDGVERVAQKFLASEQMAHWMTTALNGG